MANIIFLEICSFKNKKDNIGTKIYPNDSNMAISFSCTPLLIAQMFTNNAVKKIKYEKTTIGFTISYIFKRCSLFALVFNNN